MFNDWIDAGANITIVLIGIVAGGIGFGALFLIADQQVQNSGNPQLQASYQTGKEIINDAGNVQDGSDIANSLGNRGK